MRFSCALLMLATFSLGLADTLTLRNGRTVQGSYVGGTSRQIRMAVGDRIETYDISEVSNLRFEPPPAEAPVAEAPPPRPALRAEAPVVTAPAGSSTEIPPGTAITVRMIDDVDSSVHSPGQTFRASLDEPVVLGERVVIPRGADVTTRLVEVRDPGKLRGGGELTLELVSILVNGRPLAATSQSVGMAGESRSGQTAKVIGGTAALGAIIGAIAGGGRGAAIGAASGAGAGTAIQVFTKGARVRIPSETRLTFTLQQHVHL